LKRTLYVCFDKQVITIFTLNITPIELSEEMKAIIKMWWATNT